jgi:hypothetical protein
MARPSTYSNESKSLTMALKRFAEVLDIKPRQPDLEHTSGIDFETIALALQNHSSHNTLPYTTQHSGMPE